MGQGEVTVSVAESGGSPAQEPAKSDGSHSAGGLDLDGLEKVARDAPVGSWERFGEEGMFGRPALVGYLGDHGICGIGFLQVHGLPEADCHGIADHIATFDPPTVLRLIAAARLTEVSDADLRPTESRSDGGEG